MSMVWRSPPRRGPASVGINSVWGNVVKESAGVSLLEQTLRRVFFGENRKETNNHSRQNGDSCGHHEPSSHAVAMGFSKPKSANSPVNLRFNPTTKRFYNGW